MTTAPARIRSALEGLIPGTSARSDHGHRGHPLDQLPQGGSLDDAALDGPAPHAQRPAGRGREVADRPPQAHHAPARFGQPVGLLELDVDVFAQILDPSGRGRSVGKEALGHTYGPEPPGARLAGQPIDDPHELHRAPAEIDHATVHEGCGVDGGHVAVPGLGLPREDPDRQARPLASPVQEVGRVLGIPDGARRNHVDLVLFQVEGAAHLGELGERLQGSFHRPPAQPARGAQAFADADGLGELLGALPGVALGREDDQAEGVRAHVDHGEALGKLHRRKPIWRVGGIAAPGDPAGCHSADPASLESPTPSRRGRLARGSRRRLGRPNPRASGPGPEQRLDPGALTARVSPAAARPRSGSRGPV